MSRWCAALAALALASCATVEREEFWSVRQVMENADSLAGRTIMVRGWLDGCQPLSCGLYDSAAEARRDRDPDRGPRPGDEHAIGFYLSVGGYPWFDREAAAHTCRSFRAQRQCGGSYVVLLARVDGRCMDNPAEGWMAVCADRPDTLVPIRVVSWGR